MADEKKTPETPTPGTPNIEELQAELAKIRGENEKLKSAQSNASSDAAKYKKMLQERMSEQEKADAAAKELLESLKAENERLKKEQTTATQTAGFLSMGMGDAFAKKAAEAAYGVSDFSALLTTFKEFLTEHDKQMAADALRKTPKPSVGGAGLEITKEQFDKMGYAERAKLAAENPDLYNKLK